MIGDGQRWKARYREEEKGWKDGRHSREDAVRRRTRKKKKVG